MSKEITIIMPHLNEGRNPQDTLDNLFSVTDSDLFDIVAIDDATEGGHTPLPAWGGVRQIVHTERVGVDECRHEGVLAAKTPYVFIIDAHMQFSEGWLEKLLEYLHREPSTVFCTTCLGLGFGKNNIDEEGLPIYKGATIQFIDPDVPRCRNGEPKPARQVLEPKWLTREQWGTAACWEIPCVLGANYGMSVKWYNHIKGLAGLKMWGTSEPFLSMKSWLAGGSCKVIDEIEIGHLFRDQSPFTTYVWNLIYNKLYMMAVMFPSDLGNYLSEQFVVNDDFRIAQEELDKNLPEMMEARKYFHSIAEYDVEWFMDKFDIQLPAHRELQEVIA